MTKSKMIVYIGFIVFLILAVFSTIGHCRLHTNGVLLNAHTLDWATGAKMEMTLKYEFYFHGEREIGNNPFKEIWGRQIFLDKYFPVIYDPKFGISELLIQPSDFKGFDLPFPDSLNWVLPYFK